MIIRDIKLNTIIRVLVGLFFIISGVFKMISIDSFEIYIYSFGLLNLNLALIFARLLISSEFLIGILIISGVYFKKVIVVSIAMLTIFTLFIAYLLITNNDENCHCFGEVIILPHIVSLLKNLALIGCLIYLFKGFQSALKYQWMVLFLSSMICIAIPFILSTPDTYMLGAYSKKIAYNEDLAKNFIIEKPLLTGGKKVLCFFGTGCRFCKLTARKISVIANKSGNRDMVKYLFLGSDLDVQKFFKETSSITFDHLILPADSFLKITNGKMPLILLLDSGAIKGSFNYRSINESELLQFMK